MAPSSSQSNGGRQRPAKLSSLPRDTKINKRPLLRGPIASSYAGKQKPKIVYVSTNTQFMVAFKRVKCLLEDVDKRETQAQLEQEHFQRRQGSRSSAFYPLKVRDPEPVLLKATGKAIDKALRLALYLQQQSELSVMLRTNTVNAIDDILDQAVESVAKNWSNDSPPSELATQGLAERVLRGFNVNSGLDIHTLQRPIQDLPETQLRQTSEIEITVTALQS